MGLPLSNTELYNSYNNPCYPRNTNGETETQKGKWLAHRPMADEG